MRLNDDDLSTTRALVVDGNPTSRAILVNQLREFGVGTVEQSSRAIDARKTLELRSFDIVLCEQYFAPGETTGQDLLDDLRRNQLLPLSTVFIMVTGEASYAKVAEAAESALDAYLIKPHTAARLAESLHQARQRKATLADIFMAIDAEDYARGAELCLQRFRSRGPFWLYAARVGAELLLRVGRCAEAQQLYEAVIAAKTVPWARLGVARSQIDSGNTQQAVSTLASLLAEEPRYADAYDVLARAQLELGNHDQALAAYRMACEVTPYSISRLQSLGLMSYYSGERAEAEKQLSQAVRLGLDSKMFDSQTLVLLAFARLEKADRRGMQQCRDDLQRLAERRAGDARLRRQLAVVDTLLLIQDRQFAGAVSTVREMARRVKETDFDFETALNLLALMAQLADKAIRLEEVEPAIDALGLRFSTEPSTCELLAGAAAIHPPYAVRVRAAFDQTSQMTDAAMSLSLSGNPTAAVRNLIAHGTDTLNAKLIDTASRVLRHYAAKVKDHDQLQEALHQWHACYGNPSLRPALSAGQREAGSLSLREAPAKSPAS